MKIGRSFWIAASLLCAASAHGQSKETIEAQLGDVIESVKTGCQSELASHCAGVTPGEGRTLACLYAYQDKLSVRCEYALYDASSQLGRMVAALTYVSSECGDEMKQLCADAQPGQGRVRQCLEKNAKQLSARCSTALRDVHAE